MIHYFVQCITLSVVHCSTYHNCRIFKKLHLQSCYDKGVSMTTKSLFLSHKKDKICIQFDDINSEAKG